MHVLQVHNYYLQSGGEEVVFEHERELLLQYGHRVERHTVSNEELKAGGAGAALKGGLAFMWSRSAYRDLLTALQANRPDVIHVHNTFPLLSPSIYWAARKAGVPLVQTLHNFRITCANGLLMREGAPCEACVGRSPLAALQHRCFRDSLAASGAVVASQRLHAWLGTYRRKVDAYIALTEFAKGLLVRAGLPSERVHVKPNFVPVPNLVTRPRRNQVIFVGRLHPIKGVDLLLEAWSRVQPSEWRLVIVGDGPERAALQERFGALSSVEWRGWLAPHEVLDEIAASRCLAMASRSYENFPMVLLEAFATRTPAIAPDHAGFPEIVRPGCGFLFEPGRVEALAACLREATSLAPEAWEALSSEAHRRYRECYAPEQNHRRLLEIYQQAIASRDGAAAR